MLFAALHSSPQDLVRSSLSLFSRSSASPLPQQVGKEQRLRIQCVSLCEYSTLFLFTISSLGSSHNLSEEDCVTTPKGVCEGGYSRLVIFSFVTCSENNLCTQIYVTQRECGVDGSCGLAADVWEVELRDESRTVGLPTYSRLISNIFL